MIRALASTAWDPRYVYCESEKSSGSSAPVPPAPWTKWIMYRVMQAVDTARIEKSALPKFLNASSRAEGEHAGANLYRYCLTDIEVNGKDVVDIGCYRGGGCDILNSRGARAIGVDIIHRGDAGGETWTYVTEDGLTYLSDHKNSFDVVMMVQSVRDMVNSKRPLDLLLAKAHDSLRSGGICIICDWSADFSLSALVDAAEKAGFKVDVAEMLPVPSGLSRFWSYLHVRIRKE